MRPAELASITELLFIITDRELTESEIRLIQLTDNIYRADLSQSEKWLALEELKRLNPGRQLKDLAAHLHLDPSTVTRMQSPARCSLSWREALAKTSDCYQASLIPEAEQSTQEQVLAVFARMKVEAPEVRDWFRLVLASQTRDAQAESLAQRGELQRPETLLVQQQDRLLNLRISDDVDQKMFARKHTEIRDRLASIKLQLDS